MGGGDGRRNCFEAIPHSGLMRAVQERICDQSVLKLLRAMLRAGVMQDGAVSTSVAGTPQGGVASPLLCNVYLHRIDRAWDAREHGTLIRFADDALVMCKSREQAEAALQRLRQLLGELGLEPKEAKTRIVHLRVGGEGLDFLGFHHRMVDTRSRRTGKPFAFLARWPADKAMQHARDRIRELTDRRRLLLTVETIRRGREHVPDRVECVLQVRQLRRPFRHHQGLHADADGAVRCQTAQTFAGFRMERGGVRLPEPSGPGQPCGDRCGTQAREALAGETECRR
jgi:hypothetical protein